MTVVIDDAEVAAAVHLLLEAVETSVVAHVMELAINLDLCSRSLTDIREICQHITTSPLDVSTDLSTASLKYGSALSNISNSILNQQDAEQTSKALRTEQMSNLMADLIESLSNMPED